MANSNHIPTIPHFPRKNNLILNLPEFTNNVLFSTPLKCPPSYIDDKQRSNRSPANSNEEKFMISIHHIVKYANWACRIHLFWLQMTSLFSLVFDASNRTRRHDWTNEKSFGFNGRPINQCMMHLIAVLSTGIHFSSMADCFKRDLMLEWMLNAFGIRRQLMEIRYFLGNFPRNH